MAVSRISFMPAGQVAPVDFNMPTLDLSTLGTQLASILKDLPVMHVFAPSKLLTLAGAGAVGGRDLGANDRWYNGGVGNGPTATTINGNAAWNFSHANQTAFRLARSDTHRSWSVIGGVEITSGNLALTQADGARSIFIKIWDSDGAKYNSVRLVDTGDDLLDYWTIAQEGVPFISATSGVIGRHVFCASFKHTDLSLRLYVDSATSMVVNTTVSADKNNNALGKWGVGGYPAEGYDWEGPLGYMVFLHGELHGSAALDAARLAAMTALANPVYGYNVTLT